MDALSRKRAQETDVSAKTLPEEKNHAADGYNPRLRPREAQPDPVSAETRVSRNLNQLNRSLVETPAAKPAGAEAGETPLVKTVSRRRPFPVALLLGVLVITGVFMYMLTLNAQIEERSHEVSELESSIAELKSEKKRLNVQLESKYNLEEIEEIATDQYGMVSADTLPKTYIKIVDDGDVYETNPEAAESGLSKLISGFASFFRDYLWS